MYVILISLFFILGPLDDFLQKHLCEGDDVTGCQKLPEVSKVGDFSLDQLLHHPELMLMWEDSVPRGEDVTGWKVNVAPKEPEVVPTDEPKFMKYATVETRVQSFKEMKIRLPKKRQQFAEAGFFYTGVKDHVQCFFCGGTLSDWKKGLDPYKEHAGWYGSKCLFIKAVKGQEFVDSFSKSVDNFYPYIQQSYPV